MRLKKVSIYAASRVSQLPKCMKKRKGKKIMKKRNFNHGNRGSSDDDTDNEHERICRAVAAK